MIGPYIPNADDAAIAEILDKAAAEIEAVLAKDEDKRRRRAQAAINGFAYALNKKDAMRTRFSLYAASRQSGV
jgi:ornithine carbamoyltransferase